MHAHSALKFVFLSFILSATAKCGIHMLCFIMLSQHFEHSIPLKKKTLEIHWITFAGWCCWNRIQIFNDCAKYKHSPHIVRNTKQTTELCAIICAHYKDIVVCAPSINHIRILNFTLLWLPIYSITKHPIHASKSVNEYESLNFTPICVWHNEFCYEQSNLVCSYRGVEWMVIELFSIFC